MNELITAIQSIQTIPQAIVVSALIISVTSVVIAFIRRM